jgi:hypothetical protein
MRTRGRRHGRPCLNVLEQCVQVAYYNRIHEYTQYFLMGVCTNKLDCVDVRKLGEKINCLLFPLTHFPNEVDLLVCQLKALNVINVC